MVYTAKMPVIFVNGLFDFSTLYRREKAMKYPNSAKTQDIMQNHTKLKYVAIVDIHDDLLLI